MVFPVEKLDLDLAWRRVKNDLQTGRVFVHTPYELQLVEGEQAEWLGQLQEKIARGYRPHSAVVADIPKGNGAVRPAALLCLEDRIVYAATVGAMLPSIGAGLRWSQGTVDFSYRLSESPRRVEWSISAFLGWSAFRNASIDRIDGGAAHAVLTDITGFYENIELDVLFSDLRSLGCDASVVQLLQTCLYRWCSVSGRGLPQGVSPSDILAKVYMNPIDQTVVDMGINYIRYVDDMRIFAMEVPECKKALMFLSQALRRRGLNLQSAKTVILPAKVARTKIEGIAPILGAVQKKYKDLLAEMVEEIGPYATIAEIETSVSPDDAPLEVVHEAFRENFIEGTEPFNKTLFHFLLNRLGAQGDPYAVDYCLNQFKVHPQETEAVLDYLRKAGTHDKTFPALETFLTSSDCIYDYQMYQIYQWLNSLGQPPSAGLIGIARRITFDNARPSYLRAVCRTVLQDHGTTADLDRLEVSYGSIHDDLERAQVLVSLKRMEIGRRNAFYGRVGGDGPLCGRAVRLVKEQRL
jgi:hypothetical protein